MRTMSLVAGIDCSTQSTKVLVCDADTGAVIREGRAGHPDATEVDPHVWWEALQSASSGLLDGVEAMAVAGQQHGMVVLDADGHVVRPALLWNDTRSAGAAAELTTEFGGAKRWADEIGLVPVASFTATKLRWLAEHEPDNAARVESVMLPHDWLTHRLGGSTAATTDRGDASGTGYWSPIQGRYRDDVLRLAFGRDLAVPRVAEPAEVVGETSDGVLLGAGTGDNMGAALGIGAQVGDVIVSLGTSGTAFAVSDTPSSDASGAVAGFADATGRFLPLVATLNAARVLTAAVDLLGVQLSDLDSLALSAKPGAGGLVLLPYLDGERSPDLPDATGLLYGIRRGNVSPANMARAAVEGMLCGLADGVDAVRAQGVEIRRVLLIGGAARSEAVRTIAASLFGVPVVAPEPAEYVALGAARQAAWALSGAPEPPAWEVTGQELPSGAVEASAAADVRGAYGSVRDRALPMLR